MRRSAEVVGLVPAAGRSTRIAPLPCSKEVFPVGFRRTSQGDGLRPKVACHYLLDRFRRAGIRTVYLVLREGKWDIPAYFGDGTVAGVDLAYLMMGRADGPPYSLDQAYPFVRQATVAFGFPDILVEPEDAFVRLLDEHASGSADVVLGLFPARDSQSVDMVEIGRGGEVRRIVIKPQRTRLRHAWMLAVWSPAFTGFMHEHLAETPPGGAELSVGHVFQAAIDAGLRLRAVSFSRGSYLDIGTPEGLVEAVRRSPARR